MYKYIYNLDPDLFLLCPVSVYCSAVTVTTTHNSYKSFYWKQVASSYLRHDLCLSLPNALCFVNINII